MLFHKSGGPLIQKEQTLACFCYNMCLTIWRQTLKPRITRASYIKPRETSDIPIYTPGLQGKLLLNLPVPLPEENPGEGQNKEMLTVMQFWSDASDSSSSPLESTSVSEVPGKRIQVCRCADDQSQGWLYICVCQIHLPAWDWVNRTRLGSGSTHQSQYLCLLLPCLVKSCSLIFDMLYAQGPGLY